MNVLDELRALAVQDAPERAAVDRLFAGAASLLKEHPRQAPSILRKSLPLVMHAQAHVARAAADGMLKLLDVLAALPDDVVHEAMPVLAQLLDFSIGKWSFSQSTYRFARFPPLRARILEAALAMAVAERNHTNPAVAVMALHDVIGGLQRCNAFDEPHVTDAFARYTLGQSNAQVQRAIIAYLLEHAPHVVARVLDSRPELFPSVEDVHVYRSEQRGHLVDLGVHEGRVAGLAQLPVAHIERLLRDDDGGDHDDGAARDPGQRMAAALCVPRVRDDARFLPVLRRMLDEDTEHMGICEGQTGQPERFCTRTVALSPLTQVIAAQGDAALALDALRVATPHNVAARLIPLARVCDRAAASEWLSLVVQHAHDARPSAVRWVAFEVLCAVATDDVIASAAGALAREVAAAAPHDRTLVHAFLTRMHELVDQHGAARYASLLQVWPATLGLTDVEHHLRLHSYRAMKAATDMKSDRDGAPHLLEAKRVLQETAKTDKPLAEALLIVAP